MGSTSRVDRMMQMMVTLLLAALAIMSIPKIVDFIFGDKKEEENESKATKKLDVSRKKKGSVKDKRNVDITSKKKALMKEEDGKDEEDTEIIREGKALMKRVATVKTSECHKEITNYAKMRCATASETDPYFVGFTSKNCVTKFDKKPTEKNEDLDFDEGTQTITLKKWKGGKPVTAFTRNCCKPGSVTVCCFKIGKIGYGYNHEKKGVYFGLIPYERELRKGKRVRNMDFVGYPNSHLFSTTSYYYGNKCKVHIDGNCDIDDGDFVKIIADQKLGICCCINLSKSVEGDIRCCAVKMNKALNYRFGFLTTHPGEQGQIPDGSTGYNADSKREAKGAALAGKTIRRITDKAAKKKDINRQDRALMERRASVKDKSNADVNREGKDLMKRLVTIKAIDCYPDITKYVKNRCENALKTDLYSMGYNDSKNCVTTFDKKSTIKNEYIEFNEPAQMVTETKWRNGGLVPAVTKPKCKPDSIHCCCFKINRIGSGYQGKKGGVYIGIMKDTGSKPDSYMIDQPTGSAHTYLMSTTRAFSSKKGTISVNNWGIDEGNIIKVLVDQQLSIISFINMTKSTRSNVCVAAFRIHDKSLVYRFVALFTHKGDCCQIVNESTESDAEREEKTKAVSAGNRIGGWAQE